MKYKIFHGPGVVHFIEGDSTVVSGQPNQEEFTDESKAIARVVELDEDFFPKWDREETYEIGDLVMFGESVFRALQENDASDFEIPDVDGSEIPTPRNRSARWVEVYDPNYEEESDGGPV